MAQELIFSSRVKFKGPQGFQKVDFCVIRVENESQLKLVDNFLLTKQNHERIEFFKRLNDITFKTFELTSVKNIIFGERLDLIKFGL